MSNDFYTHGSYPATGASGASSAMRAELDLITAGFDKLPTLTGHGNELVAVNSGATGLTSVTASAARTLLGLVIGTNVQAWDADLDAIAALTSAANKLPYATGAQAWALTDLSAFGRSLVDDADAAAAQSTLGGTTVGKAVFTAVDAAAAQSTLGGTTVGKAVFTAVDAAAARTATGAAASGANTDITSLNAPALGAATATTQSSSDSSTKVATTAMVQGAATAAAGTVFPRSYLAGLTLSTAGSSATMNIAAGTAADSTNAALMGLAAAISKTTSAWAVGTGNGGLDTGAIANNTWYHFYEIQRPDTGVVDVCFSLSASAPTTGGSIPSAYTRYRRIGSGKTNGSAQWVLFVQNGDAFLWDAPVLDVNATNPGTSAVTPTMSTPLGVITEHIGNWQLNDNSDGTSGVLVSSMLVADRAASTSAAPLNSLSGFDGAVGGMTVFASGQIKTLTDTSSRVRYRCYVSGGSTIVSCATTGWIDRRGKDS